MRYLADEPLELPARTPLLAALSELHPPAARFCYDLLLARTDDAWKKGRPQGRREAARGHSGHGGSKENARTCCY